MNFRWLPTFDKPQDIIGFVAFVGFVAGYFAVYGFALVWLFVALFSGELLKAFFLLIMLFFMWLLTLIALDEQP